MKYLHNLQATREKIGLLVRIQIYLVYPVLLLLPALPVVLAFLVPHQLLLVLQLLYHLLVQVVPAVLLGPKQSVGLLVFNVHRDAIGATNATLPYMG